MRIHKNKIHGKFVMVPIQYVRDPELSMEELGLLVSLLGYPDNWETSIQAIVKSLANGREAVSNTLKRLTSKGYVTRMQGRGNNGRFGDTDIEIHEYPVLPKDQLHDPEVESAVSIASLPSTENPYTVNPNTDNPPQNNNNITNITQKKINRVCKPDTLTEHEYENLIREFGKDTVDYQLNRIAERGYKGCRNYSTVHKWCQERTNREKVLPNRYAKPNSFNTYPQHTDYDFEELERQLISNL